MTRASVLLRCSILAAMSQSAATLRHAHSIGRRSALALGFTSASFTFVDQVAAVSNREELENIRARARNNTLSTNNVIIRALRDELLEAKDLEPGWGETTDCRLLEQITRIDEKAANEVRIANERFRLLSQIAKDAPYGSPARSKANALEEVYELGKSTEEKIRERTSNINVRYILDCQEREGGYARRDDDRNDRFR